MLRSQKQHKKSLCHGGDAFNLAKEKEVDIL